MISNIPVRVTKKVHKYLHLLYGDKADELLDRFLFMIGRYGVGESSSLPSNHRLTSKDILLITYGDMVKNKKDRPLQTLHSFCSNHLKGYINSVHLLPFFPYSSDDGFSVIDYREVNPDLGKWSDIELFREDFNPMFDLVLNHGSSQSSLFRQFLSDIAPGRTFFYEYNGDPEDLAPTTRPRSTPLLTKVSSRNGEKSVWTTFGPDQIDFNWESPEVLFEFLDILFYYISKGAQFIRLDAIGYLWKTPGTSCIHLPQTHAVVKLFRTILDALAPNVKIITETNVPHQDNISYFGNSDEAHVVYNFSLPPLVLHALSSNNGQYLTDWAKSLESPPEGCTFLNFSASHDGIGLTPLNGLLPENERNEMLNVMRKKGAHISNKQNADGSASPYELNITYFDALAKSINNKNYDDLGLQRFLCSQAIILAFKGIPAIYFNSLVATQNNQKGVADTGHSRTINRYKWDEVDLLNQLEDSTSMHSKVFNAYRNLISVRKEQPAFSPHAAQITHNFGPNLFVIERQSAGKHPQKILCIFNMTADKQELSQKTLNAIFNNPSGYTDLLKKHSFALEDSQNLEINPFQVLWLKPS